MKTEVCAECQTKYFKPYSWEIVSLQVKVTREALLDSGWRLVAQFLGNNECRG